MKKLIALLIGVAMFTGTSAYAASILQGFQGGTGIGAAGIPDIGNCLQVLSINPLTWSIGTCGSGGGGSGGGTFATSTSQKPGQSTNHPIINTDILTIGSNSTTTAPFYFDPSLPFAKIGSQLLVTGSTTLQNFTFINATGTQATTTNFFSPSGTFTNLFGTNITGFGLGSCTGTSALTFSGTTFGCTAQPQGTITSLTGDVTGSGTGAVATTLATVNGNVGSFGGTNSIPNFTVNGKGLITAAGVNTPSIPASEITSGTFGTGSYTFPANLTITGNATTTAFAITSLGVPAGTFLAVNPQGSVIATTTPAGSSGVTSVATTNGITGGTITTTGTIQLDQTFGQVNTAASTTYVGGVTIGKATTTQATSTNQFATTGTFTNLTGTSFTGFGLTSCSGSTFLQWSGGTFACGTPSGSGGTDVNWSFFNNSGIRVATTSNQVLIGASATTSLSQLQVIQPTSSSEFAAIFGANPSGTSASLVQLLSTNGISQSKLVDFKNNQGAFSIQTGSTAIDTEGTDRLSITAAGAATFSGTLTSTGLFTGTAGLQANASSTFQNFTGVNATTSNATTTTLFVSGNASTTNFFGSGLSTCNGASSALIYTGTTGQFGCNTISAGSSASTTLLSDNNGFSGLNTFTDLKLVTRSTTTNATTTNFFATIASTTKLFTSLLSVGSSTPQAPVVFAQTGGLLSPDLIIDGVQNNVGAEMELNRANTSGTEANIDFNTGGIEEWQVGIQDNNTDNFEIWDGNDDPYFTINKASGDLGIGTSTPYSELTIWGDSAGADTSVEVTNNASTTIFSIKNNGLTTLTNLLATGSSTLQNFTFVNATGTQATTTTLSTTNASTTNLVVSSAGGTGTRCAQFSSTGVLSANASGCGSGGGGTTWNTVTGTSQTAAVNNAYITNNAALVTVTLPTTAAVGDIVQIVGRGAGLWKIAQSSGQTIHFGNQDTTTGATGNLTALNRYDVVQVVCTIANTDFTVISSIGNINVN